MCNSKLCLCVWHHSIELNWHIKWHIKQRHVIFILSWNCIKYSIAASLPYILFIALWVPFFSMSLELVQQTLCTRKILWQREKKTNTQALTTTKTASPTNTQRQWNEWNWYITINARQSFCHLIKWNDIVCNMNGCSQRKMSIFINHSIGFMGPFHSSRLALWFSLCDSMQQNVVIAGKGNIQAMNVIFINHNFCILCVAFSFRNCANVCESAMCISPRAMTYHSVTEIEYIPFIHEMCFCLAIHGANLNSSNPFDTHFNELANDLMNASHQKMGHSGYFNHFARLISLMNKGKTQKLEFNLIPYSVWIAPSQRMLRIEWAARANGKKLLLVPSAYSRNMELSLCNLVRTMEYLCLQNSEIGFCNIILGLMRN